MRPYIDDITYPLSEVLLGDEEVIANLARYALALRIALHPSEATEEELSKVNLKGPPPFTKIDKTD